MARDITTFLAWAAEPRQDERKRMGIKVLMGLAVVCVPWFWYKRYIWSAIKTRVITFTPPRKPKNPIG